ncbi:MAG: MbcA/ParS/Xre antitoxin family protein [Hydrogenophaga sp.]|uniref:MbcA/ParS/Xre antitoxin family protein n=1 Tax=Methylotenera sp. TaxID=2051956 RepID=UPI0027300298|nr:MbcA/ParS/Xre antitoxin family protein [Methylotenera sp.]MDP2231852.1 MbcA/ParS/Xre antitoxin family protein [Methylotenera sp.]MDP3322918.1 MbcA/ParS/Xre antitoxin family protein [Hydrogenophaga sp.]
MKKQFRAFEAIYSAACGMFEVGVINLDELHRFELNFSLEARHAIDQSFKVLGNDATKWLNNSNITLNDHTPLELLDTKEGVNLVLDSLGRIEHGVFI